MVLHDKGGWSNPITHRTRHKLLHEHLDELMADYFLHNPKKTPSKTTLEELMVWSYRQTIEAQICTTPLPPSGQQKRKGKA